MSTIFSFTRFYSLCKEHMHRTWKSMAVISMIVSGLLAIALVYFELQSQYTPLKYEGVQRIVFSLGFLLMSIGFCVNFYYSTWHSSKKIAVLSLPVSAFERTLLSFIWMTLFFTFWYSAIFYLINMPILKWANSFELQAHHHPSSSYRFGEYFPSKMVVVFTTPLLITISFFIVVQTVLLASLLWFKRYAVVKSLAIVFLISLFYAWFQNYFISTWLTPPSWVYETNVIRQLKDQVFTEFDEISANPFWATIQRFHLQYVWLACWGIIFYRIKEQEV